MWHLSQRQVPRVACVLVKSLREADGSRQSSLRTEPIGCLSSVPFVPDGSTLSGTKSPPRCVCGVKSLPGTADDGCRRPAAAASACFEAVRPIGRGGGLSTPVSKALAASAALGSDAVSALGAALFAALAPFSALHVSLPCHTHAAVLPEAAFRCHIFQGHGKQTSGASRCSSRGEH